MEELNQNENEELDSKLNQGGDSEDDDLDFLDEEPKEEPEESEEYDESQGSQKALELLNTELKKRGLNKNYKSWDDVAKSEKQRDIDFAKKGMEKKEEKKEEALPSNLSERLLRVEQPDSQFIIDEIKKDHPGRDPYEIWNSSEYYKREAAVRAENERNKLRITNPSGNSEEQKKVDEMSKKFMKNFPPSVQKAMDKMKKA